MSYRAPVADIAFALKYSSGFGAALAEGLYGDLDEDLVNSVLEEAGRFATEVIAPLNRVGDRQGAKIKDGVVTTADGWKEAYRDWSAAGWNGISGPTDWGGQGLPHAINSACIEMWNSAAMAFGIGVVLTMRRDGDRRHRAPIVVLRQEPHGVLFRIVVVPVACELDLDAMQPGDVEEVARQLPTRSGQVRPLDPVALQDVPHPPLRPQKNHQQHSQPQNQKDRHVLPLALIAHRGSDGGNSNLTVAAIEALHLGLGLLWGFSVRWHLGPLVESKNDVVRAKGRHTQDRHENRGKS